MNANHCLELHSTCVNLNQPQHPHCLPEGQGEDNSPGLNGKEAKSAPGCGRAFKDTPVQVRRLAGGFLLLEHPRKHCKWEPPEVPISFPEYFQGLPGGDQNHFCSLETRDFPASLLAGSNHIGYHSSFQISGNMIKPRNKTLLIHTEEQRMWERRTMREDTLHQETV